MFFRVKFTGSMFALTIPQFWKSELSANIIFLMSIHWFYLKKTLDIKQQQKQITALKILIIILVSCDLHFILSMERNDSNLRTLSIFERNMSLNWKLVGVTYDIKIDIIVQIQNLSIFIIPAPKEKLSFTGIIDHVTYRTTIWVYIIIFKFHIQLLSPLIYIMHNHIIRNVFHL